MLLMSSWACIHSPLFLQALMAALLVTVLIWMLLLAMLLTSFMACVHAPLFTHALK